MARENLASILQWQYPGQDANWEVRQDAAGGPCYITRWAVSGQPQPNEDLVMLQEATYLATGRDAAIRQKAVNHLAEQKTQSVMVLRALMLVLLDELNLHAAKMNAILTAIDSGSNLAAVKANVAAIADYPARTAAQVRTAINGKLTAGDADS